MFVFPVVLTDRWRTRSPAQMDQRPVWRQMLPLSFGLAMTGCDFGATGDIALGATGDVALGPTGDVALAAAPTMMIEVMQSVNAFTASRLPFHPSGPRWLVSALEGDGHHPCVGEVFKEALADNVARNVLSPASVARSSATWLCCRYLHDSSPSNEIANVTSSPGSNDQVVLLRCMKSPCSLEYFSITSLLAPSRKVMLR